MAIALAEAGADIVGVSASLEAEGSDMEPEVLARAAAFSGFACDFGDRKAVYALVAQLNASFAAIDILVNNAGTILRKPAAEHPDAYWNAYHRGGPEFAVRAHPRDGRP